MEEEVQYCKNCKRDISAKNFVIHSAHCERKIQLCDRCSEPVPRSEFETHNEEFHSQEPCSDCGISVEKCQIEKHKETCAKKLVSCEYCELEVPLDKLSEHTAVCGSRTEQCPKCKKHVMIKDLKKHPTKCLRRETGVKKILSCEYCELEFPSEYFYGHMAVCGSRTEQCSKCKKHVMMKDQEKHFIDCLGKEPEEITCEYCDLQINLDEFEVHTAMCGTRTERCLLCNEHVMVLGRDTHFAACREKQRLRLTFPCKYCGDLFLRECLEDHSAMCESRTQKCEKCDRYIELKNINTHSNVCQGITSKNQLKSKTHGDCPVCHQSIPWVEMNVHSTVCARMHYETYEYDRQNQLNEQALMKESEGSIDRSSEEKKHQLNQETKMCSYCFEEFPYRRFAQHLEDCQERPYNCEKCLKAMAYRNKEEHVSSCRGRRTERHYANANMLHDEEMDGNKELKRLKKCQFCNKKFPDVLFQHHMEECEHSEEKCILCAENVPIKDIQEHKLLKCKFARIAENRTFNNRSNVNSEAIPEPSKNFDSMRHLEKNVETCPSCKCKIPEERYNNHLHLCYEGKTRCNFCDREITKKCEHEHFKYCPRIAEIVKEDNNSRSKKKTGEKNEGKSMSKTLLESFSSFFSNKERSFEKKNTVEVFGKSHSSQLNQGPSYERGNMTPIQPPPIVFNELPCEFCGEMWPFELIIEHQSGCRPDLVSFPKNHEGSENQKFATAATASQISHTPILGASPKSTREDDNEWKVQSRRNKPTSNRENIDYKIKERNLPQKQQLSARDKFFYYSSQDSDEVPKNQSGSSNKKRYPQLRQSPEISKKQYPQLTKSLEISKKQYPQSREIPEISKTKPDKEIGASCEVKNADPEKNQFTSFKFSTSECNEKSQNNSNSWKENDGVSSMNAKIYDGAKKSNSYNLATEFYSGLDCVNPNFDREKKAVGAERTERNRIMHSREDVDADLSLVNKDFEEIPNLITFEEYDKRNEPSKFIEAAVSNTLNLNMPAIWNTEYNYDNKGKDETLSSAIKNIEHMTLNSNILDTNFDEKNDETFGSDFVESINNNQNKEDESDTLSNSDDTFYDADDGGAKFVDTVYDNIHCSGNTPKEKLNPYDFDNLNLSSRHQRENLNYSSFGDSNVGIRLEEEDLNPKDSDFSAYYQFLFKSVEQTDDTLSYRTTGNCKCGNKECCCETSSITQNTSSLKACSFKDASSSKRCSEPMNVESFVAGTKASTELKSKKSSEVSSKKKVDEIFANDEENKWKKWRPSQASDSE